MLISEILDGAATLIEPEGAWTQGRFAANEVGVTVQSLSRDATCFCAVGALRRIAGGAERAYDAVCHLQRHLQRGPTGWNDRPLRTQSEVVSTLRAAAEKAREQGL